LSALNPSGLRLGAPAMTSRGLVEADFEKIAEFIDRSCQIADDIQKQGNKKKVDFDKAATGNAAVAALRADVNAFASVFEVIGQ